MKNLLHFAIIFLLMGAPLMAQPQTTKNFVDSLGRKQGYWVKLNKDTLKYEGNFKDDYPIGEFRYFYPDKTVKSIVQYSEKGLMAKAVNYNEYGKKRAEGEYWDKKKHGLWKYFNDNGRVILIEDYHNGIPEGEWIKCYDDGRPLEIKHYTSGKLNGVFMEFYPDSLISVKGNYKDGMMDGPINYYYLDGKVMISGNMNKELRDGVWMYFNERSQSDKRLTFSLGNLVKEEITIVGFDRKMQYIDIDKIAYVFAQDGKVTVRLTDGTDYLTERKLDEFSKLLNEYKFFRVNANYFISMWSLANRKTFQVNNPVVVLNPAAPGDVYVADIYTTGFLHWAGLIRGEVDPKNPDQY